MVYAPAVTRPSAARRRRAVAEALTGYLWIAPALYLALVAGGSAS